MLNNNAWWSNFCIHRRCGSCLMQGMAGIKTAQPWSGLYKTSCRIIWHNMDVTDSIWMLTSLCFCLSAVVLCRVSWYLCAKLMFSWTRYWDKYTKCISIFYISAYNITFNLKEEIWAVLIFNPLLFQYRFHYEFNLY